MPVHLEYVTSYLVSVQRSHARSWGEIHQTLYADYTEWADLPPATMDNVMCALRARNVWTTPIDYTGRKVVAYGMVPKTTPTPAPTPAAPRPAVPSRGPTTTTTPLPAAPTAAPKAPKGNIAVPGVASMSWADIVKGNLCANCYSAAHRSDACTVACRKLCCHPPHSGLARFDGHQRRDCKAK